MSAWAAFWDRILVSVCEDGDDDDGGGGRRRRNACGQKKMGSGVSFT